MWSLTGYDWSAKSPEFILDKLAPGLNSRRGEIALLHDGGHLGFGADRAHTVEATRRLLEANPGRRFISVSELSREAGLPT